MNENKLLQENTETTDTVAEVKPAEEPAKESASKDNRDWVSTLASALLIKKMTKKSLLKEIREWVVSIAVALLIVLVLRSFVFTIIRVDGSSMYSTLLDGERLFVTVYDVKFGDVERDDVVICYYPNRGRTNFVKRVVAVPGDTVYRTAGVTHVVYTEDGKTIDTALDPNKGLYYYTSANDYEPYVLGEDEYFVVGDNRYNSHDSRDWNDSSPDGDVGPISKDMIIGHVRQVIWPLNEFRTVE